MVKLDINSIATRVIEHGWSSLEELKLITDTVIEEDATEAFINSTRGGEANIEDLFDYTEKISKQVQRIAIEVANKQAKESQNG